MLVRGLCFLTILYLPKLYFCEDFNYEEDVDSIVNQELGDNPFQRRKFLQNVTTINSKQKIISKNYTISNYSEPLLSGDEIIANVLKTKLRMILNRDNNRVHDLIKNVDGFQKLTDTFKVLKKQTPVVNGRRLADTYNPLLDAMLYDAQEAVEQIMSNNKSLRFNPNARPYPITLDDLDNHFPPSAAQRIKFKAWSAMYTHVYRAQYYIALAQKMRDRYIDHPRYRLGFTFCLCKQLYREQKTVLRGLVYTYVKLLVKPGILTSWALYTYEKVQRLERDLRDLMQHIKNLEYERKMLEIPNYYEYFDSSTGRHSG